MSGSSTRPATGFERGRVATRRQPPYVDPGWEHTDILSLGTRLTTTKPACALLLRNQATRSPLSPRPMERRIVLS
jgi:hypothetical protein